ncbi:Oxidant-induced cell-cycle arrest protein 5 [[Candida] zeylanoides]
MADQVTSPATVPVASHEVPDLKSNLSSEQLPLNRVSHPTKRKPVFSYDADLLQLCMTYLNEKNHHGLALLSRQKGVPPFLRFKIWPVLLKYHPFVLNPFLQPDNIDDEEKEPTSTESSSKEQLKSSTSHEENDLDAKIHRDLKKYIQRLNVSKEKELSGTESEIFDVLEKAICKFIKKWGKIIKYDKAMAWVALGLAEWFPPIPKTPWVLAGRNLNSDDKCYKSVFEDYQEYIDGESEVDLESKLNDLIDDESISNMKFQDVFERLALVLLHSPEKTSTNRKINKSTLPINGGTIEERVSFFIYLLRKLLPELSTYFQEEQILNKFGSHDDEWLIWWLKWCGSKVWSRFDRGRIWDLMLGYKQNDNNHSKKLSKLKLDSLQLIKLGPDIFWSAIDINEGVKGTDAGALGPDPKSNSNRTSTSSSVSNDTSSLHKASSFKDLIEGLREEEQQQHVIHSQPDVNVSPNNDPHATESRNRRSSSSSSTSTSSLSGALEIPISRLDPHIELIFVSLALLKSKEHTLVELDQHEMRQYLSKLPSQSYNPSDKYKQHLRNKQKEKDKEREKEKDKNHIKETPDSPFSHQGEQSDSKATDSNWKRLSSTSSTATDLSQGLQHNYKVNYIDNVLNEAGELWRKWLWREMMEDD